MAYLADIQILLDVNTWAEACDATSEMMRGLVVDNQPLIIDWQHTYDGYDSPRKVTLPDDFERSEAAWPAECRPKIIYHITNEGD